jgi:hypothetical protein
LENTEQKLIIIMRERLHYSYRLKNVVEIIHRQPRF